MSNNLASADPSILPYYVATYKGRSVAIKRDAKYETTINLVQKSIPKLRTADIQDIFISTTLSDYGGALVQLSEEIWPDVVSYVRTVEITLEGDDDMTSEPTNMRPWSVTRTARHENAGTTATTDQNGQDPATPIASRQHSADSTSPLTGPQDVLSITVRTPSHALLELNDLRSSTKIKAVKSLIEDRYEMPAALQSLDLLGKSLDDSMTLAQSDVTFSSIVDLSVGARQCMIYLCPGSYNTYGQCLSYQNVKVRFSLNRVWELAALRHPTETLPKDYVQSVSWNVDVAENGTLTEHGSGTKLSYLFWDGVAPPTQPATPNPPSSRSIEPSQTGRPQLTPLLDPRNSTAVPFGEVYSYIQQLLQDLNFNWNRWGAIAQFASHLKKKPYEYLALRFMPQAECETIAPLSISPPTNYITRIFVLYKGLSAPAAHTWDSYQPNYAQGAAIWKDIAGIKSGGWGVAGGCLNVLEISWMEVL